VKDFTQLGRVAANIQSQDINMFIVYTQKYSSPVLTHVINTAPIAAEIKTSIIDGEISG
jgi:hypothetical protein